AGPALEAARVQPILQEEAVGQAGQHIVLRQVLGLLLGFLALRDIARRDDDAANPGMIEQVVAQGFQVDPMALRMPEAELDRRLRGFPLQQFAESLPRPRYILGVDRIEWDT